MSKRISQLVEKTQVSPNDYLLISDTTAGDSKKIKVSTLTGNPTFGWATTGEAWSYSAWDSTVRLGTITVPTDATTKYTPGMRVSFSQPTGGTKYGVILTVAATSLGVFFPSGTTFTNEAISTPIYSSAYSPLGFNSAKRNWELKLVDNTQYQNGSYTAGTYINLGSLSLALPTGEWELGFEAYPDHATSSGTSGHQVFIGLTTSVGTWSHQELIAFNEWYVTNGGGTTMHKDTLLSVSSKTTFYLQQVCGNAGIFSLNLGSRSATKLYARCAYV